MGVTLHLADLGDSEQAAIRKMLDAFRNHGWRDVSNTALIAVHRLSRSPRGLRARSLAMGFPAEFTCRTL